MPKTMLTVGTRKGAFLLESDDRRKWTLRGPFCEGWPVYHAIYDPATGSIYAAAASEWHGSAVWRSPDLGETWEMSSEGLSYGDEDGRKVSKVSTLARAGDRLLVGVEAPGIFESRDNGETWSLLSTLSGQPGSEGWDDPANQPPGHLGISGFVSEAGDSDRFFAIVQGVGAFETEDGGTSWTPRNRGLRRDWPAEHEEVGFCVHKLVRSADPQRMYQQNHVGMHRSDDAGQSWSEITEGLPSDFGFAAAAHPHDRDTFYVIPVEPMHGRVMHDGKAAVWRTRDGGSSWTDLRNGLPQENAHLGVLRQAMVIDTQDAPGVYFGTSTGQVFASADEGETWSEIASYLPSISSVDVAVLD
ncbi:MAG: exo-alpha-sialidase [Actinobacteria bacterium]|nr:MAG: exo-alpha-sialidase [Actinomycetota bacterium]